MNDIQEYLIPGTPATYATAGEKPWKIQLEQNIPRYPSESCFSGIKMQFVLPTPAPHGMPLDVDNLCEPVFSIVVNKLGWFESKRQNIRWWQATKECGAPTGLRIEMMQDTEINIGLTPDGIIFDAIYDGDMPASAKDCQVASWAEKNYLARSCPEPNRRYSMLIQFASPTINIGDIATGKVKSFIDCMYPAIGGSAGKPEDWRIDLLQVEKGVQTLAGNTVRICIWDKKEERRRKSPSINIDANPTNADWTKMHWDLPPYKSREFLRMLKSMRMTLEQFRRLPVYKFAVEKGLIRDDEWTLPTNKTV